VGSANLGGLTNRGLFKNSSFSGRAILEEMGKKAGRAQLAGETP